MPRWVDAEVDAVTIRTGAIRTGAAMDAPPESTPGEHR
jgi:hypothetical protein